MIDKLYDYYMEESKKPKLTKYTFEEVFETALKNKILEEDPKEKTIRDYRATYKAFIDEDLALQDIRKMTSSDLKVFLQRIVKEKRPTTPDRARLLGHSVETNLRYYTFAKGDEYLDELCDILDGNDPKKEGVPQGTPKIIAFPAKEKTPEPAKFKGFR